MNKPIVYLPISYLVLCSILYISLSVPSFSLIIHFTRLLYLAIGLAISTSLFVYIKCKSQFDFENLYTMVGLTLLISFVLWLATIIFCNMQYTTKNCNSASFEVVGYRGRYTSGLGSMEKDKIKANQWILTIIKEGENQTFVLNKDISSDNRVTKTMDLLFCKGLLGTEYLNLEQIPE